MSSAANQAFTAPFAVVTSTDRGGQLLIVNFVGLIVSLASVVLRIHISRREQLTGFAFHKDDLLCFAALVCHLQTAYRCQRHTNPTFQAFRHH
jgi:hypothetical protein